MATLTTTSLLIFLAPSQNIDGSILNANQAATTYLIDFPDSDAFGSNTNATVTVGPASQKTGSYGIAVSVPNTGMVTLNCNTSAMMPTACVATAGGGLFNIVTTTIPNYSYLPVTVTAGLEKLAAASTVVASSSLATSNLGDSFSSSSAAAGGLQYSGGGGMIALLGFLVGRFLF
jgi:hypothetical protein